MRENYKQIITFKKIGIFILPYSESRNRWGRLGYVFINQNLQKLLMSCLGKGFGFKRLIEHFIL
jgi:hypothetical protein